MVLTRLRTLVCTLLAVALLPVVAGARPARASVVVDVRSATPTSTAALSSGLPTGLVSVSALGHPYYLRNATSPAARRVVRVALAQRGDPYRWGAAGPSAFDCSGLLVYAFRVGAGVYLPHYSGDIKRRGRAVSKYTMRPGDVIGFAHAHVAIFTGTNVHGRRMMVHASRSGTPVREVVISSWHWSRVLTVRRIV